MSESNPFEAMNNAEGSGEELMSDQAVLYLSSTRPWLLFMGILTALGAALMIMGGLVMMIGGAALGDELGMMGPAVGLIYIVMAAIYAAPAWMMLQQAMAIGKVQAGGGAQALAEVLRHHRNFWRLIGGVTLLFLILYCGGIMAVVMLGASLGAALGQ